MPRGRRPRGGEPFGGTSEPVGPRRAPHVLIAMLSYAFVDAFTRVPREEAIERLKRAIAAADGVIVDFAFYGSEALRLTVELDAGALAVLRRELESAEVELFQRCVSELEAAKKLSAERPVVAMLHVMFAPAEEHVRSAHPS